MVPEIEEQDLRVGSKINILKREFLIKSYGDLFTQKALSKEQQKTFVLIKPDGVCRLGEIVDWIE